MNIQKRVYFINIITIVINQYSILEHFQIVGTDSNNEESMPTLFAYMPEMYEDDLEDEPKETNTSQDIQSIRADTTNNIPLDFINNSKVILEGNYQYYLRVVQINAVSEKICAHISNDLASELKDIDARLRVKIRMDSIILGMDKYFAETANYPKGCGDAFKAHMEEYNPDYLLYHTPSTKGNKQDIVYKCAGPAYMN